MTAPSPRQRFIVHVDMDAFFASVEQRDNPSLKGRPVIVGADPEEGEGRGVVAACSYEAREYGIHSAMPISVAYRRCPEGVFLPVDMPRYLKESEKVFAIIEDFSPKVQIISVDEAFLDISGSFHLFGTPEDTAGKLKEKIRRRTSLSASVGLAPNKFLAKLASEHNKPGGFVVIKPSRVREFLDPLGVDKIQGIGDKTAEKMKAAGIRTVRDLAGFSAKDLIKRFGARGERFYRLARGIDNSPVKSDEEVKSVSNEYTFREDTGDKEKISSVLLGLSDKVARRLRKRELAATTVSVKIRLEGFRTYTRAKSSKKPLTTAGEIYSIARQLYGQFKKKGKVRLVGVKAENFAGPSPQLELFGDKKKARQQKLEKAVDKIREKYGPGALYRAGTALGESEQPAPGKRKGDRKNE